MDAMKTFLHQGIGAAYGAGVGFLATLVFGWVPALAVGVALSTLGTFAPGQGADLILGAVGCGLGAGIAGALPWFRFGRGLLLEGACAGALIAGCLLFAGGSTSIRSEGTGVWFLVELCGCGAGAFAALRASRAAASYREIFVFEPDRAPSTGASERLRRRPSGRHTTDGTLPM